MQPLDLTIKTQNMNHEELYRWIKASDRLPEYDEEKYLRVDGLTAELGYFLLDEGEEPYCQIMPFSKTIGASEFDGIEWLEAVPPPVL